MKFVRTLVSYITCLLLFLTNLRKIHKNEKGALTTKVSTTTRSKTMLAARLRRRLYTDTVCGKEKDNKGNPRYEIKFEKSMTYRVYFYEGTKIGENKLFWGNYLYIGTTVASGKGIPFLKKACTDDMPVPFMAFNGDYCYLPYREISKIEEGGKDFKWGNIITTKHSGSFFQYLECWWRESQGVQTLRNDYLIDRTTRLNLLNTEYSKLVSYATTFITNYDLWSQSNQNTNNISDEKTKITSQIDTYDKSIASYNQKAEQSKVNEASYIEKIGKLQDQKNIITKEIDAINSQISSLSESLTEIKVQSTNSNITSNDFKTKATTELDNFKSYIEWLQTERPTVFDKLSTALVYLNSGNLKDCISIISSIRPYPTTL
jgi:hypothetical protein